MTQKVLESQYCEISYYPENQMLSHTWFPSTETMRDAEFKEIVEEWLELVIKYEIKVHLLDSLNLRFPVSPDVQDWMASIIVKQAVESGLQKMAIILPDEFISQLSTSQAIEENNMQAGLKSQYFNNQEEGFKWLLGN